MNLISLLCAHGAYIVIYIVLLWTSSRKRFWILYVALLIMLVLNLQGCRMMGKQMEVH